MNYDLLPDRIINDPMNCFVNLFNPHFSFLRTAAFQKQCTPYIVIKPVKPAIADANTRNGFLAGITIWNAINTAGTAFCISTWSGIIYAKRMPGIQ